jgi:hypothetical protein
MIKVAADVEEVCARTVGEKLKKHKTASVVVPSTPPESAAKR